MKKANEEFSADKIEVLSHFTEKERELIDIWGHGDFSISSFLKIQEQINLFHQFEDGKIDPKYLNFDKTFSKFYYIKFTKMVELKNKLLK